MIIINADDWGRSRADTDTTLRCCVANRVTSVSAMVFMEDSDRAAALACEAGIDVGLHLNFTEGFTGSLSSVALRAYQEKTSRFLGRNKYAVLLYNPMLMCEFRCLYEAQLEEFHRLYGQSPSHVDGHQHMHLCANVLLQGIIPKGEKVRRSFSFWPGEKNACNRAYRCCVDAYLARRYCLTDLFFALSQTLPKDRLQRTAQLAKTWNVELMTHARDAKELQFLLSDSCHEMLRGVERGGYAHLLNAAKSPCSSTPQQRSLYHL